MKQFSYDLVVFSLIILLLNSVLLLFSISKYHNEYKKIPDKKFKVFVLSDSHGAPLEDFTEKYNIYNFSAGSDSYFDMKRKLMYLIENEYNVDTVFITADDHTLSPYREQANNMDRSVVYSSKDDFENNYEFIKEKYIKFYLPVFQPKISPLFKSFFNSKLKTLLKLEVNNLKEIPWSELSKEDRVKKANHRMQSQFPYDIKSEKLKKSLLEIISICKENEIDLIGLKYPLSRSYIEVLQNKNFGADDLISSKGLKLIDKKELFKNNPELFSNQDHLNSEGGELFVNLLFSNQ